MVEVFKTDVQSTDQAARLVRELATRLPGYKINFDLEDCDRILRVEGGNVSPDAVIGLLRANRHCCVVLD